MSDKKISRRDFLRFGSVVAGSAALAACQARWPALFKEDQRPNFVVIVTDDQRTDTMQFMPHTQEWIFDQGVTFDHGYITTPLCNPSRISILTGMYAHNHGGLSNNNGLHNKSLPEYLQESGYYTGVVGKYLNTWTGKDKSDMPLGFDYVAAFSHGESRYYNPRLNINGEWIRHQDQYITDVLGDYTVDFVEQASKKRRPFFLYFAPNAPHEPAEPAKQDLGMDIQLPERPPNFNEKDMSDKPAWMAEEPLLSEERIFKLDQFRYDQILTLVSLDRAINRLMQKLEETGELDNTVVIYLSDNGKFWGEHRITSKNGIYEEASRIPFGLRYPGLVLQPRNEDGVIANIDIAPTLYELAGLDIPAEVDGESLVPLLKQQDNWREGILLEGWPGRGNYKAYHTNRYVYSETMDDKSEFYDLEKDPYQMENGYDDPANAEIISYLKNKLDLIRGDV